MSGTPAGDPQVSTALARSVAISQVIANIFVVVGVGSAVWTFIIQREDTAELQRREAAMEFVMLRHEPGYRNARYTISEALEIKGPNRIFEEDQPSAHRARMAEITRQLGLARIQMVADLYLSAAACADAGICDKDIIDKVYGPEIGQFYCWNHKIGLFEIGKRLNQPDYDRPLARFSTSCNLRF